MMSGGGASEVRMYATTGGASNATRGGSSAGMPCALLRPPLQLAGLLGGVLPNAASEGCDAGRDDGDRRAAPAAAAAVLVLFPVLVPIALSDASASRLKCWLFALSPCRPRALGGDCGRAQPRGEGDVADRYGPSGEGISTSLLDCRDVMKSVRTATSGREAASLMSRLSPPL